MVYFTCIKIFPNLQNLKFFHIVARAVFDSGAGAKSENLHMRNLIGGLINIVYVIESAARTGFYSRNVCAKSRTSEVPASEGFCTNIE